MLSGLFEGIDLGLDNIFKEEGKQVNTSVINTLGWESLYEEQSKWIEFFYSNLNDRSKTVRVFLLLGSRDYGKTDVSIIHGLSVYLLGNQEKTCIIASSNYSRSKGVLHKIRDNLENKLKVKGNYKQEEIRLKSCTSKNPTIKLCTSDISSLRGNHVDIAIFDDLVTDSDETSEAVRERNKQYFMESLNVAKNVFIIGQPVNENDLYGMLENLALRIDKDNKLEIRVHRSFRGTIPQLDKDIETLRQLGLKERALYKNYFGELLRDERYPFFDVRWEDFETPNDVKKIACIDPGFDGQDSTGLAIGYIRNETIYASVVEIEGNIYNRKQELLRFLNNNNVVLCYVESNDNGGVKRSFYESNKRLYGYPISFKGYVSTQNKKAKILSIIGSVKDRLVLSAKGDFKEITEYSTDKKKDDVADSLACLINFMLGNSFNIKQVD